MNEGIKRNYQSVGIKYRKYKKSHLIVDWDVCGGNKPVA